MTTSEMVRQICKESHVSLSELARRIGQSPQNFSKKLQRETLTLEELNFIGEALGVNYEQSFIMSTGRRISTGVAASGSQLPGPVDGITALPSDHPLRKALTGDYNTVIYVDGPTGHCTFYTLPRDIRDCFGKVLDRNPGFGIVSSLLIDNYVCPDDRREIANVLEMKRLRETLEHTPIVSKIFRSIGEDGEKYSELRIIRIGDGEKMQGIVVAVIDRDEMIREKVESSAMNRRLLSVTASLARACSFVASVNMKEDIAWICRISKPIQDLYGNIEMSEMPFRDVMCPVLFRDIHPEDLAKVERALSKDSIREGLAGAGEYFETFRYKFDDHYYHAEMRVSLYGDGSDSDNFVLSFLNRDKSIRERTEWLNQAKDKLDICLDELKDYPELKSMAEIQSVAEMIESLLKK